MGTLIDRFSMMLYVVTAAVLGVFALIFIIMGIISMGQGILTMQHMEASHGALNGIGLVVLGIAVFEIAKYLHEEQAMRDPELSRADESRRTLTKFITIIIIAVALEALVLIFESRTGEKSDLLYPVLLFGVDVFMLLGLAAFQWMARRAETIAVPKEPDEPA